MTRTRIGTFFNGLRRLIRRSRSSPSYHDLYITTASIARTSIFDLPYGLIVMCTRTGGWELWLRTDRQIGGEYGERGLRLDVNGVVIVDSLTRKEGCNED